MNLVEYENNQYTKEKDEVEKYLLRITQRYFDIENNYTKESIEAMIIEALTRFKQMMITKTGFIFSLNHKTGNLVLTANDFNGELAIDKNTAFNKDFGDSAGTICEGNDSRLSDSREPLQHIHEIVNIKSLQERLDKINIPDNIHIHKNKELLDILIYTGKQAYVDLTVLDTLQTIADNYYSNLETYQKELSVAHSLNLEKLSDYIFKLKQSIQNASNLIDSAINWLLDIHSYTSSKIDEWRLSVLEKIARYATVSQLQKLTNAINKTYSVTSDGEISLTNGTVSLVPVEKEYFAKNNTRGSLQRKMFEEGMRIGKDNWIWDSINHAVSYHNETFDVSMILSPYKFESYTHRVTLKSDSYLSRVISVVIAYDEAGDNNLTLVFDNTDIPATGLLASTVTLCFNYKNSSGNGTGTQKVYNEKTFETRPKSNPIPWNTLKNGITVLVKRNKNNIKIWFNYNNPNEWFPVKTAETEDIPITQAPDMEINLDEHPELSMFTDTKNSFGYGCYCQAETKYTDMYFIGQTEIDESYGSTNVMEYSETKHHIPNTRPNDNIKMFFKYDKNGETITHELPFMFIDENNNKTLIQGAYSPNGDVQISTSYINHISQYVTDDNLYNDETIIAVDNIEKDIFCFTKTRFEESGGHICKIDSEEKNTFVSKLLKPDIPYYIDGEKSFVNDVYYDKDNVELGYFNWANNLDDEANKVNIVTKNGLWENVTCSEYHNAVIEYSIKKFTDYFKNPRVYYQILGNKEVV